MTDPHRIILLATLLGALGLWLLLPRGAARGRAAGAVLALVSLGLWAAQLPRVGDWLADGLFFVLAAVTIIAAAGAVTFRSPVYCAIWFGMTLAGMAGLFLLIGAQFLAVATLVVYAGAILVTFLFVLMLSQPEGHTTYDRTSWEALLSAGTGSLLVGILSMALGGVLAAPQSGLTPPGEEQLARGVLTDEHVARLGVELFTRHLVAVEVAGVLLLAALVGAAVIIAQGRNTPHPSPLPEGEGD